jgi:hypothetical protein
MSRAITLQQPHVVVPRTGYGFLYAQCKGHEGVRNEVMAPVALNLLAPEFLIFLAHPVCKM